MKRLSTLSARVLAALATRRGLAMTHDSSPSATLDDLKNLGVIYTGPNGNLWCLGTDLGITTNSLKQVLSGLVFTGLVASLPAASGFAAGSLAKVTDVGLAGGTLLVGDGTYWHPLNGSVLLGKKSGSLAAPVASITLNGAAQVFGSAGSLSVFVPPQLIIPGACNLQVKAEFVHHGTAGTVTPRVLFGTANNSTTSSMQTTTLAASEASQCILYGDLDFKAINVETTHTSAALNAALTSGNMTDWAIDFTNGGYINFGVNTGVPGTGPDTLDLVQFEVRLNA